MSIKLRCTSCHKENPVNGRFCLSCGASIPDRDRTYRVQVCRSGRRRSQDVHGSLTLANTVQAGMISSLEKAIEQGDDPETGPVEIPTLEEVYAPYLSDYLTRGKGGRQFEACYRTHVRERFGGLRLNRITVSEIEDMVADMRAAEYAPKTQFNAIDTISRLFRQAIRLGLYRGINPCLAVRRPRINNKVTQYLTKEQVGALLAVLDAYPVPSFSNLIRFLLFTGCRQGEAFRLEWRDVDLERRTIRLREPKGGVDQTLPLNSSAAAALSNQREQIEASTALVFPSYHGRERKIRPWRQWFAVRKAAGLPADFRLHDLRHTFASWLASSGEVDLQTLQALLTHKESRTTQRYAHLFPATLRAGADVLDRVLDPKREG